MKLWVTAAGGKSIHGPYGDLDRAAEAALNAARWHGESIVHKGVDLAQAEALVRVKQYARYETILRALRNTVRGGRSAA